jgi:membrane protease YdiL (CAAX protease family)
MIKGPLEEFGWRGFAQPLLQRKMAPVWVALLIGIVWGFWHLPAFLLSGTQQSAWSFSAFFGGTIAISLIMTPLYNASRGSIFLAAFMHFQLMNPIWPDAQPYDTYILIPIALIVVWLNRQTMLSRTAGLTEIIPDTDCDENTGGHDERLRAERK